MASGQVLTDAGQSPLAAGRGAGSEQKRSIQALHGSIPPGWLPAGQTLIELGGAIQEIKSCPSQGPESRRIASPCCLPLTSPPAEKLTKEIFFKKKKNFSRKSNKEQRDVARPPSLKGPEI